MVQNQHISKIVLGKKNQPRPNYEFHKNKHMFSMFCCKSTPYFNCYENSCLNFSKVTDSSERYLWIPMGGHKIEQNKARTKGMWEGPKAASTLVLFGFISFGQFSTILRCFAVVIELRWLLSSIFWAIPALFLSRRLFAWYPYIIM